MTAREDSAGRSGGALRRASRRSQAGFNLIEVLVSVFLVGTVILAIAAGMLTMLRTTVTVSDEQRIEAAILSYGEWLHSQPYVPCATAASYPAWAGEPGLVGEIISVQYWQPAPGDSWGDPSVPESPYGSTCSADQGRQLLELRVELIDRRTDVAHVVLREDT